MGELSAALNRAELGPADCPLPAQTLGALIQRIKDGTISGKIGKGLFETLWQQAAAGEGADASRLDINLARGGDLGFSTLVRAVPLNEAQDGLALPGGSRRRRGPSRPG